MLEGRERERREARADRRGLFCVLSLLVQVNDDVDISVVITHTLFAALVFFLVSLCYYVFSSFLLFSISLFVTRRCLPISASPVYPSFRMRPFCRHGRRRFFLAAAKGASLPAYARDAWKHMYGTRTQCETSRSIILFLVCASLVCTFLLSDALNFSFPCVDTCELFLESTAHNKFLRHRLTLVIDFLLLASASQPHLTVCCPFGFTSGHLEKAL